MSTVGAIVDRLYRTYLEPPDYQPVVSFLNATIDASVTSLVINQFAVPEDEQLMRVGVLLEIDSELMRVRAYVPSSKTATIDRGVEGTTASAHTVDAKIIMDPSYPRSSVFEAVADNITTLYPSLYTVASDNVVPVQRNVAGLNDDLAVEVLEIWPDDWSSDIDYHGRIVDFHPTVGGRAVLTNVSSGNIWVRYRRRMGVASAEADTLVSLGVDERWTNIVLIGTAADLLVGRDISAAHVEWVGQVLQAENIAVGTRQRIGFALAQYRDLLLDRAKREMRAEYKPQITMADPLKSVTRRGFG